MLEEYDAIDQRADTAPPEGEPDLVMALMGQMVNNAHSTWHQISDNQEAEIKRLRAQIVLITEGIEEALTGPYAPSERVLRRALYPYTDEVDRAVEEGLGDYRH